MVAASGLLVMLLAVGVALGALAAARQRAAAAADMGALAAASRVQLGTPAACAIADQLVLAQGGRLVECSVDVATVTVRAAVSLPPALRALGGQRVIAAARAGP